MGYSSMLLNGVPGKQFLCKKGVIQGDPLSPLVFGNATDVLQSMLNEALHNSNARQLQHIKNLLLHYAAYTGLKLIYVRGDLQFNFVGFYNGWNKFLKEDTTQAFVFTDRAKDASVVVVAFRGTEPFNMQDWSTDVNLSWLGMGAMGHVHAGFLKALGLQEEDGKDANRAFPKDAPNGAAPVGKAIAYYKLREVIRDQLKAHPQARLVITGHSLGGALAAVFPALLALHGESEILGRLGTVQTYGQPRVGDATFVSFFRAEVEKATAFYRVVYRYDVVSRVPFDAPPVAEFAHGGSCVYYDGWYDGKVLPGDVPNPNYFDPRYLLSMYGNALGDLVKGAFLWTKAGKDYREGPVSLLYRASGLLVPGLASHSPRDYVNAVRLGRIAPKSLL
ncbi:triacylglycerol lipase OBL1-like [Triticum aestivum]|uniref:triacylglycerol lipase OBL1-like n=1 Tax=Triticum aestivum TaxID=4565 RepID=UPI001D020848|nr:triacylglycerol lipase OBL1-like [Triticum aestivum]